MTGSHILSVPDDVQGRRIRIRIHDSTGHNNCFSSKCKTAIVGFAILLSQLVGPIALLYFFLWKGESSKTLTTPRAVVNPTAAVHPTDVSLNQKHTTPGSNISESTSKIRETLPLSSISTTNGSFSPQRKKSNQTLPTHSGACLSGCYLVLTMPSAIFMLCFHTLYVL